MLHTCLSSLKEIVLKFHSLCFLKIDVILETFFSFNLIIRDFALS